MLVVLLSRRILDVKRMFLDRTDSLYVCTYIESTLFDDRFRFVWCEIVLQTMLLLHLHQPPAIAVVGNWCFSLYRYVFSTDKLPSWHSTIVEP